MSEIILDWTIEEATPIIFEAPSNVIKTFELPRVDEALIGTINGVNTVFTTTQNYISGSTQVFINGLKQKKDVSYEETAANEITFTDAPTSIGFTDELTINYISEE